MPHFFTLSAFDMVVPDITAIVPILGVVALCCRCWNYC